MLFVGCNAAVLSSLQSSLPTIYAPSHGSLERYSPAIYDFAYSVHDSQTGDIKSQQESRRGDVVQGQYSLVDPDGLTRIVDYHADDQTGFNAHVRREPGNSQLLAVKPAAAAITTISSAQPAAQKPVQLLQAQKPLLGFQQQFIKPGLASLSQPIGALQTINQQSSSLGVPLALAPQTTSISLGHQSLPLALAHQTTSPIALTQSFAPLAALQPAAQLTHNGLFAQHGASLAYNQALAAPYAIAHTAPIAYQAAAPLSHLLAPAALAIHH